MNNYDENDFDDQIESDMEYELERKVAREREEYDQEMHHPLPCTPTSHMWEYLGGGKTVGIYECITCKQIEVEPKANI